MRVVRSNNTGLNTEWDLMIFIALLAVSFIVSSTQLEAAAASDETHAAAIEDTTSFSSRTLLRMADAKTLTKNLHDAGFEHFNEKTKIAAELAGEKKYFAGVQMAMELALYDYCETMHPTIAVATRMRSDQLLKTLLKGATVIEESAL